MMDKKEEPTPAPTPTPEPEPEPVPTPPKPVPLEPIDGLEPIIKNHTNGTKPTPKPHINHTEPVVPDGHSFVNTTEPIVPIQIDPEPEETTSKLWKVIGWICILLIIALVTYIALKHFKCCFCVIAKRTEEE